MTNYLFYLITFQIIVTLIFVKISIKFNLVDFPSNRKTHDAPTPYTGGIIIATTFLFMIFITNFNIKFLNLLLSYSFLIALSGYIDDRYKVNPGTKIILQILPIILLINSELYLVDLGDYYYFGKIILGSFDKVFTLLCCLFIINASNYCDGIDSLLSIITSIILIVFAIILYNLKILGHANYLILISTTLIVHSIFNFGIIKGYKIFLGDSGSNLLGFIISFITINLYLTENIHPALLIWPLTYLVFEFLSVNFIRIINKKALFKAGNDHFHYLLKKKFKINNYFVIFIISTITILTSLIGYFINQKLPPDYSLLIFIFLFIIYFLLRYKFCYSIKNKSNYH